MSPPCWRHARVFKTRSKSRREDTRSVGTGKGIDVCSERLTLLPSLRWKGSHAINQPRGVWPVPSARGARWRRQAGPSTGARGQTSLVGEVHAAGLTPDPPCLQPCLLCTPALSAHCGLDSGSACAPGRREPPPLGALSCERPHGTPVSYTVHLVSCQAGCLLLKPPRR